MSTFALISALDRGESHPCGDLRSSACERWMCSQGAGNCGASPSKSGKTKAVSEKARAVDGAAEGGSFAARSARREAKSGSDAPVWNVGFRSARTTAALAPPPPKPVGVLPAKTAAAPALKPVARFQQAKPRLPSGKAPAAVPAVAKKKIAPAKSDWVRYVPSFMKNSVLVKALLAIGTPAPRVVAAEAQIAGMHTNLFANVNRAYAVAGETLGR